MLDILLVLGVQAFVVLYLGGLAYWISKHI